MKFNTAKRDAIFKYTLEKIKQNEPSLSQCVSETFGINRNTVHEYINELAEKNIIRRIMRGKYELVKTQTVYTLKRSAGDLDSDTTAFYKCLKGHIEPFGQNVQEIWTYAFTEMINNVMDHSEAEEVHVLIEQDYLDTTVFIIDDGIGIFKKIKEYFKLASLDEAICELFKGKLTTDKTRHSGEGIFFTSRMMDDFVIASSDKIFAHNKYDRSDVWEAKIPNHEGTTVMMKLLNSSQKDAKDVFDLYSNDEGDFNKTRIPLKNIFDTSPISRSQAKRLCNRFNEFKEITLDFEGLEWMGQGFAHELFVVFGQMHPEVDIVPINMSASVEKMYKHVING